MDLPVIHPLADGAQTIKAKRSNPVNGALFALRSSDVSTVSFVLMNNQRGVISQSHNVIAARLSVW